MTDVPRIVAYARPHGNSVWWEWYKTEEFMAYDSTEDTRKHQVRVRKLLEDMSFRLLALSAIHDNSKLNDPEKEIFDEFSPKLKDSDYDSEEYKGFLKEMKVALDHHYAKNRHHPEHFGEDGIRGMTLIDLLEMLADWKAASERHASGDMAVSLHVNQTRFRVPNVLQKILENTAKEMGWLNEAKSGG